MVLFLLERLFPILDAVRHENLPLEVCVFADLCAFARNPSYEGLRGINEFRAKTPRSAKTQRTTLLSLIIASCSGWECYRPPACKQNSRRRPCSRFPCIEPPADTHIGGACALRGSSDQHLAWQR